MVGQNKVDTVQAQRSTTLGITFQLGRSLRESCSVTCCFIVTERAGSRGKQKSALKKVTTESRQQSMNFPFQLDSVEWGGIFCAHSGHPSGYKLVPRLSAVFTLLRSNQTNNIGWALPKPTCKLGRSDKQYINHAGQRSI